jgi:hypothetical protein
MYRLLQLISSLPVALIVWLFVAVIVQEAGRRLLKRPVKRAHSGAIAAAILVAAYLVCLGVAQ